MRLHATFVFILFLLSPFVSTVTIEHYRTATCKGNHVTCSGIREFQCCNVKPNRQSVFSSAKFRGLPTTAIGNVCRLKGSNDCGSVQKSVRGLNQCAALGNARGSFWFDCRRNRQCSRLQSREEVNATAVDGFMGSQANETILPNIVGIGGHLFPVYYDTPENITVILIEIFENDGSYEDVPEEVRGMEITDEDVDEDVDENADGDEEDAE
ncbi:uncharacterized protein LDX57_002549 [Aspergillus melleus]|uniref:uncharacterized protein n=1 Tax=Aspergillus melleus TaxID=138277 RepID=UPI001E8EE4F8|nr:uncharacterized protein LDX57_002549 [Aspergillus melleus]KAH8424806.1 hypothetical protein LDX57_002549 [Aspergillus melleus]